MSNILINNQKMVNGILRSINMMGTESGNGNNQWKRPDEGHYQAVQ